MNIVENFVWDLSKKQKVLAGVGDTVDAYIRLREGNKERVQVFSGVVLKVQGKKCSRSITVRKISNGVGVERTFPLASPALEKVVLVSKTKVRRARLFYLRKQKGRAARLKTLESKQANTSKVTTE